MLRTLAYEPLRNVVASVENTVGGATVSRFGYTHDQAYRRTHTVFSGSAFAAAAFARYTHNDRAELTAADKFLGTDTTDETSPVPAYAYAYAYGFDPIGQPSEARRPTGTVGATIGSGNYRLTASDAETGTTVSKTYTPDQLNQYTAIVQPGTPPVTVSPQHDATDSRTRAAGETGDRMVAVSPPCGRTATSQTTLDNAAGNWTLLWNADSRAKRDGRPERSERPSGASTPRLVEMTRTDLRIQFLYDYRGRRVEKRVHTGTAGTGWTLSETRRFLYEGWTLVAEFTLDGASPVLDRTHLWGIDLSGSLEGAGGIGGLLRTRLVSPTGSAYYYPAYDAGGNVSEYLDAAGTVAAHYEYAPFGKTVAAAGPLADAFAFRFSTKYLDAETGLLYYGYRHLDPETGRWLSRDPLGEQGGTNLRGFVGNGPLRTVDVLGLQSAAAATWGGVVGELVVVDRKAGTVTRTNTRELDDLEAKYGPVSLTWDEDAGALVFLIPPGVCSPFAANPSPGTAFAEGHASGGVSEALMTEAAIFFSKKRAAKAQDAAKKAQCPAATGSGSKDPDGPEDKDKGETERSSTDARKTLSNQEARSLAAEMGYKPEKDVPFNSHGQPVFKKKNRYITPDVDGHNGGVWKLFDQKGRRLGTYDGNLKKKIGD